MWRHPLTLIHALLQEKAIFFQIKAIFQRSLDIFPSLHQKFGTLIAQNVNRRSDKSLRTRSKRNLSIEMAKFGSTERFLHGFEISRAFLRSKNVEENRWKIQNPVKIPHKAVILIFFPSKSRQERKSTDNAENLWLHNFIPTASENWYFLHANCGKAILTSNYHFLSYLAKWQNINKFNVIKNIDCAFENNLHTMHV